MEEIYVIYKELLSSKLALIELEKQGKPLVAEQKYDQINQIILKRNEIYKLVQLNQQRLTDLIHTDTKSAILLESIDFKITFEEIDENTIPKMKNVLAEIQNKEVKTADILEKIALLEYFIN